MRTFPPCSTTWPSMTPYGTPPSFCERVLNSTDKLAEFPGCTRPRQSTARACAGSVWPAACALRGGRPGTNRSRPGRCRPAAEPAPDQGRAMTPRQQLRSPCFSPGSSQGAVMTVSAGQNSARPCRGPGAARSFDPGAQARPFWRPGACPEPGPALPLPRPFSRPLRPVFRPW